MNAADPIAHAELARSRLAVYRFLQEALDFPTPERLDWMIESEFSRALELLCNRFDVPYPEDPLFPDHPEDCRSRYLACFEVGLPHPPVPLLASHYNRREPVPATIHEHALFYRRFGARVADSNPETADHLRNELAFLIHLDELLILGTIDTASILHARRDFLDRQVHRWVGRAAEEADRQGLPALYRCLLTLLSRAVAEDRRWQLGPDGLIQEDDAP